MVILLLWLAGLIFLIALTVCCAIACLFLTGRKRSIGINTLLVLGTLVVLINLAASLLPKDVLSPSPTKSLKSDYVHDADLAGYSILFATYFEKLEQPLASFSQIDEKPSLAATFKETEKALRKAVADYPASSPLSARLAILVHADGGNVQDVFRDYDKSGTKTELISTLAEIYGVKLDAKPHKSSHKSSTLEERLSAAEVSTTDDNMQPSSGQSPAAEASKTDGKQPSSGPSPAAESSKTDVKQHAWLRTIETNLPSGWYRQTAMKDALRDSPEPLAAMKASSEEKFHQWMSRYALHLLARTVLFMGGLWALYALLKNKLPKNNSQLQLPAPLSLSFQQVYGCLLSVLYAQTIVGFMVGFMVGIYGSLTKTPLSDFKIIISASLVLAGIAGAALCAYFFVCKPAKISLPNLILGQSTKLDLKLGALTCFQGFSLMFLLNLMIRTILRFVPLGAHSNNELNAELIDTIVSQNGWLFAGIGFFVCLIAPVTEELLFRGLLYTWLRGRWGVAFGVLASSAVFALWHMDLTGFFQYFGLGIVLAIYFERTRSVPVTACIHALWNTWIVFGLAWLMPT